MCRIHIGGEEREFVAINIRGRQFENAVDYWDGNWLNAEVEIKAGGFVGNVAGYLRTDEFAAFESQLRTAYDAIAGTAEFQTMEHWLTIRMEIRRNGEVSVEGEMRDDQLLNNRLRFRLIIDQSYLVPLVAGLRQLVERYPVVGRD